MLKLKAHSGFHDLFFKFPPAKYVKKQLEHLKSNYNVRMYQNPV